MSHIIIVGDPNEGFGFYGPFEEEDDALAHAECFEHTSWWISSLDAPDPANATEAPPQKPQLYGCAECGCTDIQSTAWVMYNSGEVVNDEPPTDNVWCPRCEESDASVKEVDKLDPHVPDIDEARHKA